MPESKGNQYTIGSTDDHHCKVLRLFLRVKGSIPGDEKYNVGFSQSSPFKWSKWN